mmetsp:Transcript_40340/g.126597  ORF Transcript_40340/g.126597 Transcript_40340/m.126597 type:complete len:107 (+) Transcript_40340:1696-2016(+)
MACQPRPTALHVAPYPTAAAAERCSAAITAAGTAYSPVTTAAFFAAAAVVVAAAAAAAAPAETALEVERAQSGSLIVELRQEEAQRNSLAPRRLLPRGAAQAGRRD